jgi:hypothetical protein
MVDRITGLFFKPVHEVIPADKNYRGQMLDRQLFLKIRVDVIDNFTDSFIVLYIRCRSVETVAEKACPGKSSAEGILNSGAAWRRIPRPSWIFQERRWWA